MKAKEVADISKLIRLTEAAISRAPNSNYHHHLEGMKDAFEMVLMMGSDDPAFAKRKSRLDDIASS